MTRELYSVTGPVDLPMVAGELRAAVVGYTGVNRVGSDVAVYADDTQDRTAVQAILDAHTPPAFGPLEPVGVLATLLVVVGTLDLADASNAVSEEPAHLEHEALAWSVG